MMTKLPFRYTLIMLVFVGISGLTLSQSADEPAPTLVPPTPVPISQLDQSDALLTESGLVRIASAGKVRVGILYNEPPFSELTIRGEVQGYEADAARAIAETWGVEIEVIQVTRQNGIDLLQRGTIDLLVAAQVHRRELDTKADFSQTYHLSRQTIMVRADSGFASIVNLAGRRVAYVVGTEGEAALNTWLSTTAIPLEKQAYLTLDKALAGLFGGEVDGIVGRQEHLLRVASNHPQAVTLLEDSLEIEPFAIAIRRQDTNLRNLVNRTLQYLLQDSGVNKPGTLENLHQQYFPGESFPIDVLPIWANLGESAPQPAQFPTDIQYPQQYILPRLASERILRVAGTVEIDTLPRDRQLIGQVSRSIIEQIATRWNVRLEFVPGDPIQLVESGQADLAIGIEPDWNLADRVDFSQPYTLFGDRLLVPERAGITSFVDLRGNPYIAVAREDPAAQARAQAWADSVDRSVRFFTTDAQGIALSILDDLNANVAFGNSLLLMPQLQASQNALEFTPRWYSRQYVAFALPRNDIDLRNLINYTLQDMLQDGTLHTIIAPTLPPAEDIPQFDIWPGQSILALNN